MPHNFLGCTFTPSITLGMWTPAAENRALGVATGKVSICRRTWPQVKVLRRLHVATIKAAALRDLLSTPPLVRGILFSPADSFICSFHFPRCCFPLFYLFRSALLLKVKMTDGFIYAVCATVEMRSDGTPENTHTHTSRCLRRLTRGGAITSVSH